MYNRQAEHVVTSSSYHRTMLELADACGPVLENHEMGSEYELLPLKDNYRTETVIILRWPSWHLAQTHTSSRSEVSNTPEEHVVHQQDVFTTPCPSILENTCGLIDNAAKQCLLVQNVGHFARDRCRHCGLGNRHLEKFVHACIRIDLSLPERRHCVDGTEVLALLWCRITVNSGRSC